MAKRALVGVPCNGVLTNFVSQAAILESELAAKATLQEGQTVSVNAKVFDDAGAVENLFSFQTLLIDKNGDQSVPHTLW